MCNENNFSLEQLGWKDLLQDHLDNSPLENCIPARVGREDKELYTVYSEKGKLKARVSGKFKFRSTLKSDYPSVGDWVMIEPQPGCSDAIIHSILPRHSCFSRHAAGERTEEQIVASNIDTVFLVSALDGGRNFNLRLIERYLTLAYSSGAAPVLILNKSDVCDDVDEKINEAESVALGVPVHAVSALTMEGFGDLDQYLKPGKTIAFLGASGVGKSSMINALLSGDRMETAEVRDDDRRGKHTTTAREMVFLPGGAILVDTPGMRELQLWSNEDNLSESFEDINELAQGCRFDDCTHVQEPGCRVRAAVEDGTLDESRYQNYLSLKSEMRYTSDRSGYLAEKEKRFKKIAQWTRKLKNKKRN